MRFAARPLARKRTPAVLNRLAPTGDYWPRASPFHGQQRLITSEWQLAEFRRVSRYPKLRKYLIPSEAGNMINGLRYRAHVLADLPTLEVSQDPDDNPVLAMAVAGGADFLVSGDKRDLLSLKVIEKTKIVTARKFLAEL
jgi:uncharacterized protein